MIFVTVGTTKFDKLIEKVDKMVGQGKIKNVVAQIGNGNYIPKNIKWFRFANSLNSYYKKSKLIISHEGAGTTFEIINLNKKAIALTNPDTVYNPDIIKKFSSTRQILWCKDLDQLEKYIKKSKKFKPKKYKKSECKIGKKIISFTCKTFDS